MKIREYQRDYYLRRKARGCADCGKPPMKGATRCSSCARIHAAQAKERYERRKSA
jgi:hypothetical protein